MGLHWGLQDLKYGVRSLLRSRGLATVAVATLALGIGASVAVFSVIDAILLKALPYPQSERIVIPWRLEPPGLNMGYGRVPWGLVAAHMFERDSTVYEHSGAFKSDSFNLTGEGEPALIPGIRASAGFFPVLAMQPALGRVYSAAEDRRGNEYEVVLSDRLWRERFHGDPAVVNRAIRLNGRNYTVVGVMPPGFAFPRGAEMPGSFNFPREPQLWVPLALAETPKQAEPDELAVICRLKQGTAMEQAQAELNVFTKRMEAIYPSAHGWFNGQVTAMRVQAAGNTRQPLLLILGAVGLVLLIACSNVANLLLARSVARRRELSVRAALGAPRSRLMCQMLIESLLLATAGGGIGMLVAEGGIGFVKAFGPANIPRLELAQLDWRVFGFGIVISLATAMIFGLAPALGTTGGDLAAPLREGARGSAGGSRGRIRSGLVIGEISLAILLVVAAGLLLRTFTRLAGADGGFNAAHVITWDVSVPETSYPDNDRLVTMYSRILAGLNAIPGVEAAGISETVPMGGAGESTAISILDHPLSDPRERPFAAYTIASPGYFAAVGTPILRGRGFLESDTGSSQFVTVISRAMAKKFWPDRDPIGKRVGLGSPRFPPMTIVGIAADVKHMSMGEEPGPEMYVPFTQKPWPSMLAMKAAVRTREDPAAATAYIRAAIRAVDPDLPVSGVKTLSAIVDDSTAQPRFAVLLVGAFGVLAITLAAIGMYGVISYSVVQRSREIGIRMALGARRRSVFRLVFKQGARLAGLGTAIGLGAAALAARAISGFLYGVKPLDPLTYAAVAALVILIALAACWLPARRAMGVDPVVAMRAE